MHNSHLETDGCDHCHDRHNRARKLAHYAARSEYRMVLANMPFPAKPMDT